MPVTVNVYDLAISVSLNFNVHGFLSRQTKAVTSCSTHKIDQQETDG